MNRTSGKRDQHPRCPEEGDLALAVAAGDVALFEHAASCVRCAPVLAELQWVQAILEHPDEPLFGPVVVRDGADAAPRGAGRRSGSGGALRRARWVAVAVLVAGAGLWLAAGRMQPIATQQPEWRGEVRRIEVEWSWQAGRLEVRWQPVPGATRFLAQLWSVRGTLLWHGAGEGDGLEAPPALTAVGGHREVLLTVEAWRDDIRVAESAVIVVRVLEEEETRP